MTDEPLDELDQLPDEEDPDEDIPPGSAEEELPEDEPAQVLARVSDPSGVQIWDELKKCVGAWAGGQASADEVLDHWSAWDADLGARQHFFLDGLRFREWDEALLDQGRQATELLDWQGEQMARLHQAVGDNAPLEAAYAVEQLDLALRQLEVVFAALKAHDAKAPALAESPQVAELLRVATLAADEKVAWASFHERFQAFSEMHEQMRMILNSPSPSSAEGAVLRARADALAEAWSAHDRGIAELTLFAESGDREALERAGELLDAAAARFAALREALLGAAQDGETRPCPFCSHLNGLGSKVCGSCAARLPEVADEALDRTPAAVEAPLPSHVQKLHASIEQARQGQLEPLRNDVVWLQGLIGTVRRRLDEQAAVAGLGEEARELLERARETLVEGIDELETGLLRLEEFLDGGAPAGLLDAGWNLVRSAAGRLAELPELQARARELV